MRTFNVSFLAVLSCIAMIGATSIGNRSPDTLPEPAAYVALQQAMEVLN
jgi:hypothetical protein